MFSLVTSIFSFCLSSINDCFDGLVAKYWAGAEVTLMILSLINEFNIISTFDSFS